MKGKCKFQCPSTAFAALIPFGDRILSLRCGSNRFWASLKIYSTYY